jgi:branched-chain amino acid transport system permease protein
MTALPATSEAGGARVPMGASLRPLLRLVIPALLLVGAYAFMGPEQFVNALTRGAIYALIALGYTMVYGIIELINFAHGDMFMMGAFVSLTFLGQFLGLTGSITEIARLAPLLVAAFFISMIVMGAVGVVIERLAYKPLRTAPRLAPLITAIGVSFILQNIVMLKYGPFQTNSPKIFPSIDIMIGTAKIPALSLFIIVVAVVMMIALQLFIARTRLGRAMRSTAADRDAAQLMGVNINRTIAITFLIGAALAGAAGVVNGLQYGVSRFDDGFQAGLKAFTAAVLGGIGNTVGAALGGFIIGFIEVGATVMGYSRWGPAIVFGTLVIVLVFRPSGLLGQQLGERA